ncbi:MAG: DUF1573 domain-containing protein [Planctomycetota bacterium]
MIRSTCLATVSFFLLPSLVAAADWRATAFPVKKHDFGTVAVAAKTEFEFPIHNPFKTTMQIRTVRASCGCTTPILKDKSIKPGESTTLVARFNTGTFRGKRGATLTVVIERPQYSEVRLRVDGYIRKDMVFHPGAVEFGAVEQSKPAVNKSKVLYAGRSDWKIMDVTSNQPWIVPQFAEVSRGGGRVNYEISVNLTDKAPAGFFQDELLVLTNDRSMPRVPLKVSGDVKSPLSISPQSIALGSVKPGETVKQKIILIGREPFNIDAITVEGWKVDFKPAPAPKKTHVVFAEFTPVDAKPGPQKTAITIQTAGENSLKAEAILTAEIRDR